jgi:regulator of chromosome condensation (RCC1) repeat-containing protein/Regulator of Chromosome Condensation (RCC1) repeat protein/Big-like domain-containing protein
VPFPEPSAVTLSPSQYDLLVGEEFSLTVTVYRGYCNIYGCGGFFPTNEQASLGSSNPSVVSISEKGVVRGLVPGAATVTALSGDATASARVRVASAFLALGTLTTSRSQSCGLAAGGSAYCWPVGSESSAFGSGITWNVPATRFAPRLKFSLISASRGHGCAITLDGRAVCYGDNALGRSTAAGSDPAEVDGGHRFVTLSVNPGGGVFYDRGHVCGVDLDGLVWCWGDNDKGQLGTTEALPTRSSSVGGTLQTFAYAPQPIRTAGYWVFRQVSAGNRHTCGLTVGGSILCWGANEFGQLGDGSTIDRPTPVPVALEGEVEQVVAGADFTCARRPGGEVLCWGGNGLGQLGQGDHLHRPLPAAVSGGVLFTSLAVGHVACGLDGAGRAWCWGRVSPYSTWGDVPTLVAGETGLSGLSVGENHACAVRPSGRAVCWGENTSYQLGSAGAGTLVPRPISGPIAP